ncbi:phage antirepressor N-terminal domain-containing protein [Clostridium butyricum]|uniref:phage antirepressor N-terminal domain-containing protein n=1 Tax=Clostridium butyricum TaxID=1492 RepID=UPI00233054C4|nr:phage antirepressor N-terminal domain-containing protein [Clostridium butyricum]MDB2162089.1 phage antirepressor N-terminal domain-containing protein [Clostridium butyricum]
MNKETINKLVTEEVPFYGDKLIGGKDDNGVIWLAVNPTCRALGFDENDSKNQAKKISKDEVLKDMSVKFYTDVKYGENYTQGKELTFISEKAITLWLAKISITNKMKEKYPKLSEKLIRYQLECTEVLHNHFMGTDEKKESFLSDMFDIKFKSLETALTEEFNKQFNIIREENKAITKENRELKEIIHKIQWDLKCGQNVGSEDVRYSKVIDGFLISQGVPSYHTKYFMFWQAICNWTGTPYERLENEPNKKAWILKHIGIDVCEYFVIKVQQGKIIQNEEGNWKSLERL